PENAMSISPSWLLRLALLALAASGPGTRLFADGGPGGARHAFPNVPPDYFREEPNPPAFWVTTIEGVNGFLDQHIRRGTVEEIGRSAGGRPIRAVFYGQPRKGKGTTTFSGSLGAHRLQAYYGPDFDKRVYLVMAAVHGGEFEGIAGLVNLLSVLESGVDLRGRAWPALTAATAQIDRLIVIPIVNMDGRSRIPLRMEAFRGTDGFIPEYLCTGGRLDGKLIGWPAVKAFIPLDFSQVQFPGGYPNDHGVNIMHDDFFGQCQPETRALLDLTARERPDLILNLHTGAGAQDYYTRMHTPVMEEALRPAFEGLYRSVHTALVRAKMQGSDDLSVEADPKRTQGFPYNLDTALDYNCGALSLIVEFPSHAYAGHNQRGEVVRHTADQLVDEELLVQQESIGYLARAGGRARWANEK
ncbi:MAG TPA: M14 family zinc carboxypeptidase, partial [Opitutaceae bacterium]